MSSKLIATRRIIVLALANLSFAAFASPKAGEVAPPYQIKIFDKSVVTPTDMAGKVVVINYWVTWCGPCKAEMPMMDAYHRRHKKLGFEIFGVVTKDSVPLSRMKKLAEVLSYPLASDLKGKYGIIKESVPTSYIIDRKGIVRYAKPGSFDDAEFAALIDPLLKETP
jgi:cytochrome c biogenesis protein CcmG, thiol:disulfide interchange protein DsbE